MAGIDDLASGAAELLFATFSMTPETTTLRTTKHTVTVLGEESRTVASKNDQNVAKEELSGDESKQALESSDTTVNKTDTNVCKEEQAANKAETAASKEETRGVEENTAGMASQTTGIISREAGMDTEV